MTLKKNTRSRPRLIVIGLDGADWDIMMPFMEEGSLPNLARLMREGCHGMLRSTIPPHTPCAWSTIFTGVNPGKHGIFTFSTLIPGTYTWRVTRSTDRQVRAFWEILGEYGLRTGVLNVPMTYPAEEINGFMVSGVVGAPEANEKVFYPQEMQRKVFEFAPNFSMRLVSRRRGRYPIHEMDKQMRERIAVIKQLLRNQPTDVFVAVISYVDAVQHHWLGDPSVRAEEAEEVIRRAYVNADGLIGDVLQLAGQEADVLVLSDHGAGPVNLYLNLGRLMQQEGWIATRRTINLPGLGVIRRLRRKLGGKRSQTASSPPARPIASNLCWERTIVYSLGTHVSLRVNLQGREPSGVVPAEQCEEKLVEVSERLADITTPKAPRARFEPRGREELFWGPHANLMPDLVALTTNGQTFSMPPRPYLRSQPEFLSPREAIALNPDIFQGTHRLDGVIIGWGPSFAGGAQVSGATVQDITPTLLHVLGLPVPAYMDGQPAVSMLRDPKAPVIKEDARPERRLSNQRQTYTEEEAASVEKRLRDLGYM